MALNIDKLNSNSIPPEDKGEEPKNGKRQMLSLKDLLEKKFFAATFDPANCVAGHISKLESLAQEMKCSRRECFRKNVDEQDT